MQNLRPALSYFFKTKLEAERQINIKLMSEITELRTQHEKASNKVCDLVRQLRSENADKVNIDFNDFTLNINDFPPTYKEQIINFIKKMEQKNNN